jgi:hypothetical protein
MTQATKFWRLAVVLLCVLTSMAAETPMPFPVISTVDQRKSLGGLCNLMRKASFSRGRAKFN